MRSTVVRHLIVVGALLALPAMVSAQEATISGTVTDSTSAVLPGVAVTAVHEATGNTFETVTDERGTYRLPVRTGVFRVSAELLGFTTVSRSGVELLVGRQVLINLQMSLSTLQETVTVTGEAPLLDVTQSSLGGNVDTRQISELPVLGRNWVDLTLLAPGSRQNAVQETPAASGAFQLNLDGQQVTQILATSFGQPRYSRDAIAEFEVISNRFDATQGRSSGIQVNAISKSGTNTAAGTFSAYFRDDRFNAPDAVVKRVLPYSNQQISTTFGGPIRRDRIHVFANYEFEREPSTTTFNSPYPSFNIDLIGTRREQKGGVRLDSQLSPQSRLWGRFNKFENLLPYDSRFTGGATRHPAGAVKTNRYMNQFLTGWTQVLSNRAVNEVKVGYAGFWWIQAPYTKWPDSPSGLGTGAPIIRLQGYTAGQFHQHTPQTLGTDVWSARDDLAFSFTKGGRHDLKLGGEYISYLSWLDPWCNACMGIIDATGGPPPANLEALFPVWNDVTTWNLAPLSSITRQYTRALGVLHVRNPRHIYAGWLQDDWAITDRLTLNLGVRYDLQIGVFAENTPEVVLEPFMPANRPTDKNNIGPRLGFAYSLNDRTVLRGGFGKYFAEVENTHSHHSMATVQLLIAETLNDGRPDFAVNPYNGPAPTYEQVAQRLCTTARTPGCVRRDINALVGPHLEIPYSYQTSIGVQRQLGSTMSFEADYVLTGNRHNITTRNMNLAYNPATGANYPFADISKRPYPDYGQLPMRSADGASNYHGLQMAFTKRMSQRLQASATYLLSGEWNYDVMPLNPGCKYPIQPSGACDIPFKLAPDISENRYYRTGDQRHRAVFNGIWELPYDFQLSGLYFYADNGRETPSSGVDVRQTLGGAERLQRRLRANGTLIERNSFKRDPLHRVDMRVQRRFRLGGRAAVDGIAEVFNLFNHANYASYVTDERNRSYGQPTFTEARSAAGASYASRQLQLGFRVAF